MMTITDAALYHRHRIVRDREGAWSLHAFWLPVLLFGSMGAIAWAIRGTTGWGGIDGTLVPGLTWGLLWYYMCRRRGIDARGIVLWIGLGIAIGGELGYGQYVSWIQGKFFMGDTIIPVSPWVGYAWFAICGIGWGAPGGIVLGWALNSRVSVKIWLVRTLLLVMLLVVIFNLGAAILGSGGMEWLGAWIAQHCPWLIFPNADTGIYAGELDKHLGRTVYTNTQNFAVLVWWLVAMATAAVQRDRVTLVCGAVIGGGFGIGFALSALWCLGYAYAPEYIDWWKMWELHAGFNLGVLYVIALNWATRRLDATHTTHGTRMTPEPLPPANETVISAFLAASGFVLIFAAGFEYFFWTGLLLAAFYVATVCLAHRNGTTGEPAQRRRGMALAYSTFFLIFMLLHGVTSTLGVVLGLYSHDAISQYDWPSSRVWLMVAGAVVLLVPTLVRMRTTLKRPHIAPYPSIGATRLPAHMIDLFTGIGIVGAVSIWPSKIGPIYAVFLCLALFAFNRISRKLDDIDRGNVAR